MTNREFDELSDALPSELEHALGTASFAPRAQFTDRVMARIAAERRASAAEAVRWESAPALEWWVRAAADPAAALALALGALLLWRADATLSAIRAGLALLPAMRFAPGLKSPLAALGGGEAALALALAVLPAVAWASWRLGRWAERRAQSLSHAVRPR